SAAAPANHCSSEKDQLPLAQSPARGIVSPRHPKKKHFHGFRARSRFSFCEPVFPDLPALPTQLPARPKVSPLESSRESQSILRCGPDERGSARRHPISENRVTTSRATRRLPRDPGRCALHFQGIRRKNLLHQSALFFHAA